MTVLVGMLGVDNDLILFSDGYAHSGDRQSERHRDIKTMRLNEYSAVGIAGNTVYGNQVLANLIDRGDLVHDTDALGKMSFVKEMGVEYLDMPEMTYDRILEVVDDIFTRMYSNFEALVSGEDRLGILLVGLQDGEKRMCSWESQREPLRNEVTESTHRFYVFPHAPGPPQTFSERELRSRLEDDRKHIKRRMKWVAQNFASDYPNDCNQVLTFRRLSQGFMLEEVASSAK